MTKYPFKLYADRVIVTNNTKAYSHAGEIKNAAVIEAFIKQYAQLNSENYFAAEKNQNGKGELGFTFLSADSALVGIDQRKFNITKSGDQFLFYSEYAASNPNGSYADFKNNILKYVRNVPTPGPIGITNTAREVIVAYGDHKELRVQGVGYLAATKSSGFQQAFAGLANNEFNEAALGLMRPGDTLAIKTYEKIYTQR